MISDEKLNFLERFGDSDMQDMAQTIRTLRLQLEELEHSQMKKENNLLRKSIAEIEKNYVEVVNLNLALIRKLEENGIYWHG